MQQISIDTGKEAVQSGSAARPLPAEPGASSPTSIGFSWLLILRWGAVGCQLLLFGAVTLFYRIPIPVTIISLILVFQAASNLFFFFLKKRAINHQGLLPVVMFMDIILLTLLLYNTGGAMNPFTFLYLIHIVLSAILLRPRWSWTLALFTVLCYASFFLPGGWPAAAPLCHDPASGQALDATYMEMHLQGMLVAFSISVFFIVFFVGRIQTALARQQEVEARLKEEKLKNEKLASLATLAAGAAHEFSTPLATIAVAAGEMLHFFKEKGGPVEVIDDIRLIRQQVATCKEIIFQMSADAGEHLGEAVDEFPLEQFLAELINSFREEEAGGAVQWRNQAGSIMIKAPYRTLKRTLKGLLKNGRDASPHGESIALTCWQDAQCLYFEVQDQGQGMDEQTIAKACEPFFTTKEFGKGLGLGLYLARSVAERYGGSLQISSEPGRGTRVVLTLAVSQIAATPRVAGLEVPGPKFALQTSKSKLQTHTPGKPI